MHVLVARSGRGDVLFSSLLGWGYVEYVGHYLRQFCNMTVGRGAYCRVVHVGILFRGTAVDTTSLTEALMHQLCVSRGP